MKYIDADHLREELQKPKNELKAGNYYLDNSEQAVGYENALIDFELLIDSLQQEQPEVDLEKEIEQYLREECSRDDEPSVSEIARHFAEWGRKQVLQEIYEGKVKPVDKITAAWLDNESKAKEDK